LLRRRVFTIVVIVATVFVFVVGGGGDVGGDVGGSYFGVVVVVVVVVVVIGLRTGVISIITVIPILRHLRCRRGRRRQMNRFQTNHGVSFLLCSYRFRFFFRLVRFFVSLHEHYRNFRTQFPQSRLDFCFLLLDVRRAPTAAVIGLRRTLITSLVVLVRFFVTVQNFIILLLHLRVPVRLFPQRQPHHLPVQ